MKILASIALFILLAATALGQRAASQKADRLYRERKYAEALPEYQKLVQQHANDPVAYYNLGNAYFRNQKFEEAEQAFDKPLVKDNAPAMRQRAFYNQGVSFSKQNKLEESIAAYKNALLLNPADNDARINLQKALLEKKKKDPEKDKKDDKQNNKQKKQDRQPPPQSKLNRKQVEQLLKALDQREQQVQQKMMQNRARGVTKPDKDW